MKIFVLVYCTLDYLFDISNYRCEGQNMTKIVKIENAAGSLEARIYS